MADKAYAKKVYDNLETSEITLAELEILCSYIDETAIEADEFAELLDSDKVELWSFAEYFREILDDEEKDAIIEYLDENLSNYKSYADFADKMKSNKGFKKAVFDIAIDQNPDVHEYNLDDDIIVIIRH